jgi:hypothetical protein
MIITYKDGEHTFSFDTQKVKAGCVDCHKYIKDWQTWENYKARGNYCQACNAKYLK